MYNSNQSYYNNYTTNTSVNCNSGNNHELYGGSDTFSSYTSPYLQRSSSSLSLQNSMYHHHHHLEQTQNLFEQNQLNEIYDLHQGGGGGQMRRVFSTGDIVDPYVSENCSNSQEIVGVGVGVGYGCSAASSSSSSIGRVGRYSAEERKERIERYRNKRNHRNFQKKITYACRKTLADSRPRVRGRFARNGEQEMEMEAEACEETNASGWCSWAETEETGIESNALTTTITTEDEYLYDNELWTSLLGDFSTSNLISSE